MTPAVLKKTAAALIGVVLMAGLAGLGYLGVTRMTQKPLTVTDVAIDTEAVLKLNVLKQISKKNGITEWELTADSATLLKDKNQAVLVDVSVTFHTKDNKQVHLTSQKGTLDTKSHDMAFSDRVLVDYDGARLKTDQLQYRKKAHIIYSDFHVTLEKQGSVIEGDSMTTDLNSGTITLNGRVKGKFSENFKLQ